jgi:sugar (pentulose or hexulose) kinase
MADVGMAFYPVETAIAETRKNGSIFWIRFDLGSDVIDDCTAIIDIGKTNAKVSLWNPDGRLLARRTRANDAPERTGSGAPSRALDVDGIEGWLIESLSEYAKWARIRRLVPVGHGAAAALIRSGRLYVPPMDYEEPVPAEERAFYVAQRDPFAATGSPALPQGLNLGMQLHWLESLLGPLPDDVVILPWPQYWAWRLSGVLSSEVSSLGCHTDLWRPIEGRFSDLAVRRGWAARMAPVRRADDALGPILSDIATATGLDRDCVVLCGLHDSNAALLAAHGYAEMAGHDATVLSTGTWFISLRSPAAGTQLDAGDLPEGRDCLINVDVYGRPAPSSRFMGGREAERISNLGAFDFETDCDLEAQLGRLPALVASGACVLPSFVPGVGPFPLAKGGWHSRPDDAVGRRALASLYLALVANVSLDLIASRDRLLVEGRFAADAVFVRALAALRSGQDVFVTNAEHDVAYGALRMVHPALPPGRDLTQVEPLDIDLHAYAAQWRARAHSSLPLARTGT